MDAKKLKERVEKYALLNNTYINNKTEMEEIEEQSRKHIVRKR